MKNEHEAHGSGWLGVDWWIRRIRLIRLIGLIAMAAWPARAQWVTQTVNLKAGWNAVYLHVDASHETLQSWVGPDLANPITEVWMWAPPASTVQFVTSPQEPLADSGQWRHWNRNTGEGTLARLVPNAAYLVRVSADTATYDWSIKGKPVAPSYQWTTTGLNFIGFPTVPTGAPTWEEFIAPSPDLQLGAEIFQYSGGELGAGNPSRLYALRSARVTRGQAYWLRAGTKFNRYFSPFELEATGGGGLTFGQALVARNFRLRNLTTNTLTVTLNMVASEVPPTGQAAIAGVPPLQLRGALNQTNLTYDYSELPVGTGRTVSLLPMGQPGSDVEVVLGLNRTAMTAAEGSFYAAVLRLTDSLGFSQVDVPVTARVVSNAGLWVGDAEVTSVSSYLPALARAAEEAAANAVAYPGDGLNTAPEGDPTVNVPRTYPVRLILHNPGVGGNSVLLQRVFFGPDTSSNVVIATSETLLDASRLKEARRLSTALLPWSRENRTWSFNGRLGHDTEITAAVDLGFDDQANNPFLHTFHPDHDGRDVTFKSQLPQGMESYAIRRSIKLVFRPPSENVFELGSRQSMRGVYQETIELKGLARSGGTNDTRRFNVAGTFLLTRVSGIPTLRTPENP